MKKFFLVSSFLLLAFFANAQQAEGPGCNPHFTFTQNGLQLNFSAVVQNSGWHYFWDFGDSNTGVGWNPSHTYSSAGTYVVCLYVNDTIDNCTDQYCDTIGVWLGVQENLFSASVKLFPNPVSQHATLSYFLPSSSAVKIEVVDIAGRMVKTSDADLQHPGEHTMQISFDDLAPGNYFLRVSTNAGTCVMRIVKD